MGTPFRNDMGFSAGHQPAKWPVPGPVDENFTCPQVLTTLV
jgi:hypothetical protein